MTGDAADRPGGPRPVRAAGDGDRRDDLPAGHVVRGSAPGDEAGIRAVHREAFEDPGEAALVDDLRAAGRLTHSVVAVRAADGAVVGHAGFSPATVDGASPGLGLAPVGVAASARRQGLAAACVRHGLDLARRAGTGWVVVLGDPGYYGRFGFRAASARGLHDAFGGGDAFQVLELRGGALRSARGLVRYDPAFDRWLPDATGRAVAGRGPATRPDHRRGPGPRVRGPA